MLLDFKETVPGPKRERNTENRQNEKHGDFHDADRDECQYKAEDPDRRCNDIFPTVIDELERGSMPTSA